MHAADNSEKTLTEYPERRAETIVPTDRTFVAVLRRFACAEQLHPALTFIDYSTDRRGIPRPYSYAELDLSARAIAVALRSRTPAGSRVVIACPHDPGYVAAFLGCLYAGVVAVPLFAPEAFRPNDRLWTIIDDSEPALIITSAQVRNKVMPVDPHWRESLAKIVTVEELSAGDPQQWREPIVERDALAYLQYTSGSTSTPAGVRITHRNIVATACQMLAPSPWLHGEATLVSWLPYFHDMGLITGIVKPFSVGAHAVHLAPTAFIQEPLRWLRLVSDYRACWTAAPNFALDLCVRRASHEQRRQLDLAPLVALVNGSEPIRPGSVERFVEAFRPYGLDPLAVSSGYGLAEATLGVTVPLDNAELAKAFDSAALAGGKAVECPTDAPDARQIISIGLPMLDVDVRVVDPGSASELADGMVGELWVCGPNVADGYWRQPERSVQVFGARLAGEDPAEGGRAWLRTGDLGFRYDGRLYFTGRLKELIIIAGRNHYPPDIEATVEQVAEDEVRRSAVFSIDVDEEERLVVVAESRIRGPADVHELSARIRQAIAARHGIEAHDVVLVGTGGIPKTTSRKVKRGDCRRDYLNGRLRTLPGTP